MECHIFINRPDICLKECLCEFFFFLDFAGFGIFDTADADNCLYVRGIFFDNSGCAYKEIRYFLIACPLVETEPVSGSFMIDAQKYPSECSQILPDSDKMFIRNMGVDSECQRDILTMRADFAHIGERFVIARTVQTALISEIIIIGEIPCKLDIRIRMNNACTSRKTFIQRVIAIHQADASVRSAERMQNIVLIDIFTTFASVSEVNRTLRLTHV